MLTSKKYFLHAQQIAVTMQRLNSTIQLLIPGGAIIVDGKIEVDVDEIIKQLQETQSLLEDYKQRENKP